MKNLFTMLMVASMFALCSTANAQLTMTGSDTIVDTGVISVSQTLSKSHDVTSFQAVVTKVSGTVDGTVLLEASNDGTNYVAISTDTLQLANVTTNTYLWSLTNAPYKFYRLKGTGSGTMKAIITGFCIPR